MGVIYVIWGSTYLGIAVAIKTIPPFFMAAIRFTIAGLLLIAWDLIRSPEARRWPTRRQLLDSAIVGALLLGIGNGFVGLGEKTVPSGIAAILIGMMPVWFAIFGWLYFHERPGKIVAVGVVVGFLGVAALVWPIGAGANNLNPVGLIVLLIAPLGWSHGSLYGARKAQLPSRPFIASGLQMVIAAVLLIGEGLVTGEGPDFHPETITTASILAVLYLVVFGSMLAYTTYGWLLRHAPLSLVGTYAYVNPVVAVGLGTLFLGETISIRTLLAAAVILVAVAMIVTARGRANRQTDGETDALPPPPGARTSNPAAATAPKGSAYASFASWAIAKDR
jgi:drug/metabolite transporter (DMT)-like permease